MNKVIVINDYENNSIDFLNYDLIIKKYEDNIKKYEDEGITKEEFIEDYLISKNFSFSNSHYIIVKIEDIFINNSIFLSNEDKKLLLNSIG